MLLRAALVSILAATACSESDRRDIPSAVDSTALRVPTRVTEAFLAIADSQSELRGITVWYPAEGEARILATSPGANSVQVRSLSDGTLLERFSRRGRAAGTVSEPVGIASHDSLVFVVEKTNHRVQAFRLPQFESVGIFGNEELIAPEWIVLLRQGTNIDVYVSDRADMSADTAPASRVRIFRIGLDGNRLTAGLMRTFGGEAELGGIAGIAIDSAHDRLLVADRVAGVVAFTLGGDVTGLAIAPDVFDGGADALALRSCGRDAGQWFVTDTAQSFHVFDRATLAPVTRFWGRTLAPTGGVTFIDPSAPTPADLVAVHSGTGIGRMAWTAISDSLPTLRTCPGSGL
jgi:3-phytase